MEAKHLQRLVYRVTPNIANRSMNHIADVNNAVGKQRCGHYIPQKKKCLPAMAVFLRRTFRPSGEKSDHE
jgi:hypothetical protein